jgi:steroid delta-isomerase-like uncharacterized protein
MLADQAAGNKASFRRFCDVINTRDAELISKMIDEVVDADAVIRTPIPVEATGAQLAKQVFAALLEVFPDLHITIEDLIAEGDKVVARNVVTGTLEGEFMGLPATGESVAYNEIFIVRFANGRIAESWGIVERPRVLG